MLTPGIVAVIVVAILVGATLQRVSGTGVGLVVAPVLSLLLGPVLGVLLTNMTTVVSGFCIMIAVWSRIDWRRYALIAPAAVVGSVPGAFVVSRMPPGWLSILVGSIVVFALVVTVSLRTLPEWRGRSAAIVSGLIGGFFNTASGVAAPVMVIYSRVSRWEQLRFAATLQPIFMTMGLASVVTKVLSGSAGGATGGGGGGGAGGGGGDLHLAWLAPGIIVCVLLGVGVGTLLARRVPAARARTLALALAALGGVGAIVRGVFLLV